MTRHHHHHPSRSSPSKAYSPTVSVTATRNLLFLTLLLSTLSHAFVTSNRFQTAASGTKKTATSSSSSSSSSRLNVLQVPPPSRATASSTAGDDDDDLLPSESSSSSKDSSRRRPPRGWGIAPMSPSPSSGLFKVKTTTTSSRRNGFTTSTTPTTIDNDNNDNDDDNNEAAKLARELQQVAEFVAETKLPTDVGQFQLRAYRVPGASKGQEPCVIYARDKPPMGGLTGGGGAVHVPVRIHDQCLTSEVFRSQR